MSTPKIPKGWMKLRAGQRRGLGYRFRCLDEGIYPRWLEGNSNPTKMRLLLWETKRCLYIRKRDPATDTGAQGKGE